MEARERNTEVGGRGSRNFYIALRIPGNRASLRLCDFLEILWQKLRWSTEQEELGGKLVSPVVSATRYPVMYLCVASRQGRCLGDNKREQNSLLAFLAPRTFLKLLLWGPCPTISCSHQYGVWNSKQFDVYDTVEKTNDGQGTRDGILATFLMAVIKCLMSSSMRVEGSVWARGLRGSSPPRQENMAEFMAVGAWGCLFTWVWSRKQRPVGIRSKSGLWLSKPTLCWLTFPS